MRTYDTQFQEEKQALIKIAEGEDDMAKKDMNKKHP